MSLREDDSDVDDALDFEEMMESRTIFHPTPTDEEYEELELESFKRYWSKVWDYFVQPKMGIAKDVYVLSCINSTNNRVEWKIQRTLWTIAKLPEVRQAFTKGGCVWPGFNGLPAQGQSVSVMFKGKQYKLCRKGK